MNVKPIAKLLYGFFGAIFLIGGITVLLLGTVLLPDVVRNIVVGFGHGDPTTLHIIQEFGSLMVFAGLIAFWFIRHYEHSKAFHWAMTVFWGLLALVHWFNVEGGFTRSVSSAMINTTPFFLFLLVGVLRRYSEGKSTV